MVSLREKHKFQVLETVLRKIFGTKRFDVSSQLGYCTSRKFVVYA